MRYDYRETEEGKRRFENPEIYQATLDFQNKMAELGVAWHNHYSDECTIDFCCCQGDNMGECGETIKYPATKYQTWIPSFREVIKWALEELYEECKHGDKEHQDWLKNKFDKYLEQY